MPTETMDVSLLPSNICRTCAEKHNFLFEINNVRLKYESNELKCETFLSEILQYNLDVSYDSKEKILIPGKICSDCIDKATIVYHFKILCKQSTIELSNRIQQKILNPEKGIKEEEEDVKPLTEPEPILLNSMFSVSPLISTTLEPNPCEDVKSIYLSMENIDETDLLDGECKKKQKRMFDCKHKLCTKLFTSEKELFHHIELSHAKKKSVFICSTCGQNFISLRALKLHRAWHKRKTKFTCDFCSEKFYFVHRFRCHRKMHTNYIDKILNCNVCQKIFLKTNDLEEHLYSEHINKSNEVCERLI